MVKELCDGMDIMRWTEEDEITKQVSDCHGVSMYRDKKDRAGIDDNGIKYWYWGNFCSQCHKLCISVAKEKEDEDT